MSAAGLRTLLTLAWPIVLARATQSVVGFSDALMVGPLGEDALAAASTGALNAFSIIILPMGTVFIVQSFAAQLEGRGQRGAARRYAWYGLIVAGAAMLAALVALPFIPWALAPFDYEPAVRALMIDYLELRLLSVGAIIATEALGAWYGGLGNTRVHMVVGVVVMVANVGLNWLLIQGNLGAPAMGVRGAALASAIASWIGFGCMMLAFARGWGGAPRRAPGEPLGLRARELWRVLRFGLPNGLNWFLEFGAFALFINVMVADLGTVALAAFNVVLAINSVSFMPAFGVTSAGAILVGQALGAKQHERVWPLVRLTGGVAMVWMGAIGLSYLIAPQALIDWFATDGEKGSELIRVGAVMLMLSTAWQLFDASALTLSETLRAAGDTAWCLWARVTLAWAVFTPAAYLAVVVGGGGEVVAMLCVIGYLGLLAAAFAWRFKSGAWKRIDLVGEPVLVE